MNEHKQSFIRLALASQVLKFGDFTLKSGRKSPYFFNAGLFYTNKALRELGQYYADLIIKHKLPIQHLFGPAYKGLPLATTTAIAMAEQGLDVTVTFNRKEIKSHGEGGQLIGAPLTGNTAMIDDVITAGTAFRESRALIESHGGKLTTVVIALDRCERGLNQKESAIEEIQRDGIQVLSIITLFDLIDYLKHQGETTLVAHLEAHHDEYGTQTTN